MLIDALVMYKMEDSDSEYETSLDGSSQLVSASFELSQSGSIQLSIEVRCCRQRCACVYLSVERSFLTATEVRTKCENKLYSALVMLRHTNVASQCLTARGMNSS